MKRKDYDFERYGDAASRFQRGEGEEHRPVYEAAGPVVEKSDDLYSAAVAAIAAVCSGADEAAAEAPGWQVRAEAFGPEVRLVAVPTDDSAGHAQVAKMLAARRHVFTYPVKGRDGRTVRVTIPDRDYDDPRR